MKYDSPVYNAAFSQGILAIGYLDDIGFKAAITGGALRVEVFGGITGDIDVAVLCHSDDVGRLNTSLRELGYLVQHIEDGSNPYTQQTAFLADWRLGLVNIIAYDIEKIPTFDDLILGYDLNINAFYYDGDLHCLASMDLSQRPFKVQNLSASMQTTPAKTRFRIVRFTNEYPDLDWSDVVLPDNNSIEYLPL